MYVARSLSYYKNFPESLHYSPSEGPNLGYMVIQDEESETYSCFGLCKNPYLTQLLFPQNKTLTIEYVWMVRKNKIRYLDEVVFIPVLNQPLSSNRYYVIKPNGSHEGEAFACSKEEDMATCCFCKCVSDVKPRPLDPHDVYQQFEIIHSGTAACKGSGSFYAKSLTDDGYPPYFLRRKSWQIYTETPKKYVLGEAKGIDHAIRSRLPEVNFPPSTRSSNPVVVGKWYCPFIFIKEGRLTDQVKESIFYEMTLEQRWERIFEQENEHNNKENIVSVTSAFSSEAVVIGESHRLATWDDKIVVNGVVWFTGDNDKDKSVGLNLEIVERMRWEEKKVGWVSGGDQRMQMVKREEKFEGIGGRWNKFSCYVLVERFVLKRMDGRLVLAYDFGHTHQIKTIFE